MSRTDKDMPARVRAEWWQPWHFGCEHATYRRWREHLATGVCDLPPDPDVRLYREYRARSRRRVHGCIWEPVYDHRQAPPPRWYIARTWHRPQRQQTRVQCLNAAKEYNANGGVDTIPSTGQARNDGKYYWW